MAVFKIASYNLHGFEQGELLARHICDDLDADVLFIQESWLSPDNVHKMCSISSDYIVYGISAMNTVVSKDILSGRPFGGLFTLIHDRYKNNIVSSFCSERFNIILLGTLALVNVYLPKVTDADTCSLFNFILRDIFDELEKIFFTHIILGGDINLDPAKSDRSWNILAKYLTKLKLDNVKHKPGTYTFFQEKLGHFSCIDHFFTNCSAQNDMPVNSNIALNDYRNFSDHLPVILSLDGDIKKLFIPHAKPPIVSSCNSSRPYSIESLNWEKADCRLYYELTRVYLEPVIKLLNTYETPHAHEDSPFNNLCKINSIYNLVVSSIQSASRAAVPVHKKNYQKFWWDQLMSLAKDEAMCTHAAWVDAGKPRSGPIFQTRNQAKYKYRLEIKNNKNSEKLVISDKLQEDLCNKNSKGFWKTWKSKFNIKHKSPSVNGLTDPANVAELFANNIKRVIESPLQAARQDQCRSNLATKLTSTIDESFEFDLDTEMVDTTIRALKLGKASDYDGLTAEHFQYAHPCLTVIIARMFKLILTYRVVPDGFGSGLSHPIPKSSNKTISATVDDFRTITICPVISKIFEMCVFSRIEHLLKSSPRQFGFKKGTGCGHATYILKHTVDYYTDRESNVCVGVLDLSKAFDRLNHHILFSDLLSRKVPVCIIYILMNWYDKTLTRIMWDGFLSKPVQMCSGVRQGGILSPPFFSVYVDGLFKILENSNLGCFVEGFCVNTLMYADDLILVALTISDLRKMFQICNNFFAERCLSLNISKCSCARFGPRFNVKCVNIVLNNMTVPWSTSFKYLGVQIMSNKIFKCDFSESRRKFFNSFNVIYGRVGHKDSVNLLIHFLSTICVPALVFGTETALGRNAKELARLVYAYNRTWSKIFKTFDKNTVTSCQYFSGCLPLEYQIDLRRILFYKSLNINTEFDLFKVFFRSNEVFHLFAKYDINLLSSIAVIKTKIWLHFTGYVADLGII